MKKVDVGTGTCLLILSAWLFWYSGRYKELTVHVYGPDLFPRVLAILMTGLAIGLIVNAVLGKSLKMEDRIDPRGFLRVLVSIAICIGYLFLIPALGFASATGFFLFILMTLLRQRPILVRVFSSITTSLIVWAIFRYFLVIPLPEGLFF